MPSVADCLRQHAPDYLAKFGDHVPLGHRKVIAAFTRCRTGALFDAAAQSIRDVGSATSSLQGCQLGFFGVPHTWGRDPIVYHPHVHVVVPGGGVKVDENGQAVTWRSTPTNFLFHHGTLVRVYKAKLANQLRSCGLYDQVQAETWKKTFVVDIEPAGDGRAVLKYLAPYVHSVAISDSRIVGCDETSVTFRHKPSSEKAYRQRTVIGTEFVRGFVQHTLPPGFQKIRHYGWMSSHSKGSLDEVKWLVWLFLGWTFWLASGHAPQREPMPRPKVRCAQCGSTMRVVDIVFEPTDVLSEQALAYLDSG